MRKTLLIFFVTILFGSAFAQSDFLGRSKSDIIANSTEVQFQEMTTDDGLPFLYSEVAELGKIFLFFNEADICNINALYPANDDVTQAIMGMLAESAESTGENSWTMTGEDGVVENISWQTDESGQKYFLILLGE